MESTGASIEFRHVSVAFADGAQHVTACHDVSFSVEPGESVALIGPSGCGKSTTLRMAAGLLAPSEGEVLVNGSAILQPRQTTALIPQDLGLFPWKNVLQNAALGLAIRRVPKAEALERTRAALAQVELAGFERSYPKELSGGMCQRLALARALAMDADLLLMDEPLSAIDALLREQLQDTLLDLWRERAFEQLAGSEWISGTFDRVVFRGEGDARRAEIYDWKTNRLRPGETPDAFAARMAETYAGQMRAYRAAVARLAGLPADRVSSTLLLTATRAAVPVG